MQDRRAADRGRFLWREEPGMLRRWTPWAVALWVAVAWTASAQVADPEVSNVAMEQTAPGVVELTYDLAQAQGIACYVHVMLSKDGGTTYLFPLSGVSGDVGPGVTPGTGKHIVWRAFEDYPEEMAQARLRIYANLPEITVGGIEFVFIPPGIFEMGEVGAADPVHTVTLTGYFWASKYEITQAQWENVMSSNPSKYKPPTYSDEPQRPVETVSWDDCQSFASTLNAAHPGYTFGLLTEAQWEYACRADTTTSYHYWGGNEVPGDYAWYNANASITHAAGGKRPNAWGLYDTYGNVWEWVQDRYGVYSATAQTDPTGPETGPSRVLRGGSFLNDNTTCQSAWRYNVGPNSYFWFIGLRLKCTKTGG